MKPRLTTLAFAALALTGGALAQIEPLTCHGPGATHDCRIAIQPLDALAAAHQAPKSPISAADLLLEQDDPNEARAELLGALTTAQPTERARLYFLLGLIESRLGNHHAAASAFGSVHPVTFASRYNDAIAKANAGHLGAAQTTLERLLADTLEAQHGVTSLAELPDSSPLTRTTSDAVNLILKTAATLHYMNQTPLDAVTTLEQLLKVTPRTPELAYLTLTSMIDYLGGHDAVLFTQRAANGDSRDLLLGRAYAKADMHDYAQKHYHAALQRAITQGDAAALTEIAHYYALNDQWPQAARAATESLRYDPTNHANHTILALELDNQARHAEAAEQYQRALQHGADPSTNAHLALAHAAAGDRQAAIAAAETALNEAGAHPLTSDGPGNLTPGTQYALLALLARTHHALNELPEALAYADAASKHELATHDMHTYAGDLAMTNNDPTTALAHYQNANQNDPHVTRATYHAHLQLQQYEPARQTASNLKDQAGETLHLIAWAYALEGDTRSAHHTFQRAAQTGYAPAQQILERLN